MQKFNIMLGAIIGDIVGSKYEFNNTRDYNFVLFPSGCSFTDDTICTIAIADAILNEMPYRDSLLSWCRKYPNPIGAYGSIFSQWIRSHAHNPYNSFGNGAAMRVSPIGWAFRISSDVLEESKKSAECTHNHPEGIKGAQTIALCTWYLANHRNFDDAKIMVDDICIGMYGKDYAHQIPSPGDWDVTCQGCVPLAVHLFLKSKNFEDAIRLAVSYGGDSDTLGAIVGSLAGAYYEIPEEIRLRALSCLPSRMTKVISKFEKLYCER